MDTGGGGGVARHDHVSMGLPRDSGLLILSQRYRYFPFSASDFEDIDGVVSTPICYKVFLRLC